VRLADREGAAIVAACDKRRYRLIRSWANEDGPKDSELLNARMLTVPLYVFVSPRAKGDGPLKVLVLNDQGRGLANSQGLKTVIGTLFPDRTVEIDEKEAKAGAGYPLADTLTSGTGYSAVAIYGEEPSEIMREFRLEYRNNTGNSKGEPPLIPRDLDTIQTPPHQFGGETDVENLLLEYPDETFYRFDDAPLGQAVKKKGTFGISVFALNVRDGQRIDTAAEETRIQESLPFLVSDARKRFREGTPHECCAEVLSRLTGSAALVAVDGRSEAGQRIVTQDLEYALLMYAFLSARRPGASHDPNEERLRGLMVAAALAATGEKARLKEVQQSVGLPDFTEGTEIRAIVKKANVVTETPARNTGFGCDTITLVEDARKIMHDRKQPLDKRLRDAWGLLIEAVAYDPKPAIRKAACGMTQVVNYNPYLDLAQIAAIQRSPQRFTLELVTDVPVAWVAESPEPHDTLIPESEDLQPR
jgi:hypothetical protein